MKTAGPIPEQRVQDYPLKVIYPHGGERFLLLWTTDYDRGKLLVADTLPKLKRAAWCVFKEHPTATIVDLRHVELVRPGREIEQRYAQHRYNEAVSHCWYGIAYRAGRALDAGQALPEELQRCPGYLVDHEEENPRVEADDPEHYSCRRCSYRIIPAGHRSPADLYEQVRLRWREIDERAAVPHSPKVGEAVPQVPKAPLALNDRLFAALVNGGPHSDGATLRQVTRPDWSDGVEGAGFQSPETSYPVLFFFQDAGKKPAKRPFTKLLEQAGIEWGLEKEREKQKREREQEERLARELRELTYLFKPEHREGMSE